MQMLIKHMVSASLHVGPVPGRIMHQQVDGIVADTPDMRMDCNEA